MTKEQFIQELGLLTTKDYKKHKILPSLTIAQGILESGAGTSELAVNARNYFGMKWSEGCGCDYYAKKTGEQKKSGEYYTITAKFRKYATMKDGVAGYYDFINSKPWYNNLKGVTDYKTACKLIKEDGWATSLRYTQNLIRVIEENNLTKYDDIALEKTNAVVKKKCNIYPNQNDWEDKIITLQSDEKVIVTKDIGNGWSKVTYGAIKGYVKNSALKREDNVLLSIYPIRKTKANTYVRTERVVDKINVISPIPANEEFILLGKDKKWAKIKYNNQTCFIWKGKTNVK